MSSQQGVLGAMALTGGTTDTRQRILRVTLQLVAEHGIGAVSNRQVAHAAGVSLGSLTYHFSSQSELLRDSLLMHVSEEVERIEGVAERLRSARPSSMAEVASEVEHEFLRSMSSYGPMAELEMYLYAARDPELQAASRRSFAAYEVFAAAALLALGVPEPERHAPTVVAYMTGYGTRGRACGAYDMAGVADGLLTIIRGASVRTALNGAGGG